MPREVWNSRYNPLNLKMYRKCLIWSLVYLRSFSMHNFGLFDTDRQIYNKLPLNKLHTWHLTSSIYGFNLRIKRLTCYGNWDVMCPFFHSHKYWYVVILFGYYWFLGKYNSDIERTCPRHGLVRKSSPANAIVNWNICWSSINLYKYNILFAEYSEMWEMDLIREEFSYQSTLWI